MRIQVQVLEPGDVIESWMGTALRVTAVERDGDTVRLSYVYAGSGEDPRTQTAKVGQTVAVISLWESAGVAQ